MLTLSSMAYKTLWLLRGASEAPLKYQGRSLFRPHVTKSYFETYKSYDHMQKFRPKSQNLREQKIAITRSIFEILCSKRLLEMSSVAENNRIILAIDKLDN